MNVIYHISTHNAYIASIGFDSLANFYTRADSHAGTDDNSSFNDNTGTPTISYGIGGVDDAEDADVVVHEYSHAVSNNASPNGNNGYEREGLDEGLADYFATSYSRSLNEFRWADMFTWDGHNEYWSGRTAQSTMHYPANLTHGQYHEDGQMWNTALMVIWPQLGRTTTDKLMLQTLYSLGANISYHDAALMFMQADTLLNNGVNICIIANAFYNRGFIDSTYTSLPNGCTLLKTGINDGPDGLEKLRVVNTDGFAFRNEPVMVETIDGSFIQKLELLDVTGKTLTVLEPKGSITYLSGNGLAKGVYLLRVYAGTQYSTYKLVKAAE